VRNFAKKKNRSLLVLSMAGSSLLVGDQLPNSPEFVGSQTRQGTNITLSVVGFHDIKEVAEEIHPNLVVRKATKCCVVCCCKFVGVVLLLG